MPDENLCLACENMPALPGSDLCEFCTDEDVNQRVMEQSVLPQMFPKTSLLVDERFNRGSRS